MGNVTAKRRKLRDNLEWKVIELIFSFSPRMRHGGRDSSYRGAEIGVQCRQLLFANQD
jgi:hypothetical protein